MLCLAHQNKFLRDLEMACTYVKNSQAKGRISQNRLEGKSNKQVYIKSQGPEKNIRH